MNDKLLDDSNENSDYKPKNYYTEYRDFCRELDDIQKTIKNELLAYKSKMNNDSVTIDIEKNIKNLLQHYNELKNNLSEAYSGRNAPSGYPLKELDKRQKEIQQFGFNYEKLQKEYKSLENEKYRFKGEINEDYSQKEEYKYLNTGELLTLEKNKLNNQDEKLESITLDVKKNTQLAKYTGHVLKEQNKKLEQINEDIDRTEEKMNKLTNRFKTYASNLSWCKLIFIILIELAIGLVAYLVLFN